MGDGATAVVMAGGSWKGEIPDGLPRWRALAPLNGRPMLACVLDAIEGSTSIRQTLVVGPPEISDAFPSLTRLDSTARLTDNVMAAARHVEGKGKLFLVGSDIPLLTSESIDAFVSGCSAPECEFFYPIIEKSAVLQKYPGMRRTFVRLTDGTYTGGNFMILGAQFLLDREAMIDALYRDRKSPTALARFLGWDLFLRLLLTHVLRLPLLSVSQAEKLVARALKGPVRAVPLPYPEVGADLDALEEIPIYEELLRRRESR